MSVVTEQITFAGGAIHACRNCIQDSDITVQAFIPISDGILPGTIDEGQAAVVFCKCGKRTKYNGSTQGAINDWNKWELSTRC